MRQWLRWLSLDGYPGYAALPEHIRHWYDGCAGVIDRMSLQCVSEHVDTSF
jgi:hypothetical protein